MVSSSWRSKGLRFAGLKWKNITASKIMWVVIAAIAIMPLLYGALYLAAFQDPYARLNTVPVAVVNGDRGAVIPAEQRNLGDDVVQQLPRIPTTVWAGTSVIGRRDARRPRGRRVLHDVHDSGRLLRASPRSTAPPEKAQLKIDYNQSENMLASQIGETVWEGSAHAVSDDTVAAEYSDDRARRGSRFGQGHPEAADGAGDLKNSLITAHDGSVAITSDSRHAQGRRADAGCRPGQSRLRRIVARRRQGTLSGGTFALKDGTQSLVAGANQLKDGASRVASSASRRHQTAGRLHVRRQPARSPPAKAEGLAKATRTSLPGTTGGRVQSKCVLPIWTRASARATIRRRQPSTATVSTTRRRDWMRSTREGQGQHRRDFRQCRIRGPTTIHKGLRYTAR